MRFTLIASLLAGWFVLGLSQTSAQKEKDPNAPPKSEKAAKDPEITEIGGRSLEQWIKDISGKDRSKAENAIRTVVMFGPERALAAVPAMLAELDKHTTSYPIDLSVRVNICISVGMILGSVEQQPPTLIKEAVRQLNKLLSDSQVIVRFRAA